MPHPVRLPAAAWTTEPATRAVLAPFAAAGVAVRFVGGCVRDTLLGRAVSDIDLATPEPPECVVALLEGAGIKVVPTGIAHGTVTAVIAPRHFEITTLRRDVETDGRRAKVAFTDDWTADAARRDFTINAMSADPDGTVHDPFGGLVDLTAGRVRFVGDPEQRIREDVLRALRFYRFHAYYGAGEPDGPGREATRRLSPLLPILSGERIAGEMIRLLRAPDPAAIVAMMIGDRILEPVLPHLTDAGRLAALVVVEAAVDRPDPIRRLAALVPDDPAAAAAVAQRLRLSNADRDRLVAMAAPEPEVRPAMTATQRRRAQRRIGTQAMADRILLAWASAGGQGEPYRDLLAQTRAWEPPDFPLKGRDAMRLGLARGPEVGRLLSQVETWWEDGDYRAGAPECLERLRALIAAGPA